MGIDCYYMPGSSPCRAVLLCAKSLGVEMNLKLTNLMAGEHMTPDYLKVDQQDLFEYQNSNFLVKHPV